MNDGVPSGIRVGVKGAIVRDGAILLVEYDDASGPHFNLPGGGVELDESLHEAMRREMREETAADVEVGRLLMLREYEPTRAAERWGPVQKLTVVFECSLVAGSEPHMPERPDPYQTAVRWIPLDELADATLIPPDLAGDLIEALKTDVTAPLHLDR